jgi:lipopolysaccharide transport system ATP-binding protein
MSKEEIKNKFDEIVAFAEVEKFLDTPVKRYSSGMYVRLAFAVAAHLEPEILIVDEVLAVGDAEFQKKCLGKMKDVSGEGRTVLFVSHNMAAIENLCSKCIYLQNGSIVSFGETDKVISDYLQATSLLSSVLLHDRSDRNGNGAIQFDSVEIKDFEGRSMEALQCGKDGKLCVHFKIREPVINNFHIAVGIDDSSGQRITVLSNESTDQLFSGIKGDRATVEINLRKIPLKHGVYTFTLYSTVNGEVADWIQNAGSFRVEAGDFYSTGKLPPEGQGSFYFDHSFQFGK